MAHGVTIEDHTEDGHRSGEGAAVALRDGRVLLLYSSYRQGATRDHSPSVVLRRVSADGGRSWSAASLFLTPPAGALNVSSISLLRLADGGIGLVYLVKWSRTHCIPYWSRSDDEGGTWSEGRAIDAASHYYVVNNDRLVQLRDGTLLLPYALHRDIPAHADDKALLKPWLNAHCGLFYSRDGGRTWHRPDHARCFQPHFYALPAPYRPERAAAVEQQAVRERYDVFQEPGVVELRDGRLMLWVRSLSHVYRAQLDRVDGPIGEFTAIQGFNVPCSPQTIKRLPGTDALVMLYNDRGDIGFGEPTFQERTPLAVALSCDDGEGWERAAPLVSDNSRSYCYFSLLFMNGGDGGGGQYLTTFYESVPQIESDERVKRRNLASLKAICGPVSDLSASSDFSVRIQNRG